MASTATAREMDATLQSRAERLVKKFTLENISWPFHVTRLPIGTKPANTDTTERIISGRVMVQGWSWGA